MKIWALQNMCLQYNFVYKKYYIYYTLNDLNLVVQSFPDTYFEYFK